MKLADVRGDRSKDDRSSIKATRDKEYGEGMV